MVLARTNPAKVLAYTSSCGLPRSRDTEINDSLDITSLPKLSDEQKVRNGGESGIRTHDTR